MSTKRQVAGLRVLISLAVIAFVVFINVFPWPAVMADAVYTRTMVPFLNEAAQTWSQLALSPAIIVLAALFLALFTRPRWRILGVATAVLAVSFPFTFSLGYRITSLENRLALPGAELPPESLALYVTNMAATTAPDNALRAERIERAATCVEQYMQSTDLFPTWQAPNLRVIPAGWLLRFGVSGFINPFTHEPHVDNGLPDWYFEHVARHEFAHTAGFSREAEAEAIALLAGLTCADSAAQYTATVALASWVMSDTGLLRAGLPAAIRADLQALQETLHAQTSPRLSELQSEVYAQYLRIQGEDGIQAYARATSIVARALMVDW